MSFSLAQTIPAPTDQHSPNGISTAVSRSAISSLTQTGGLATAVTSVPHGFSVTANFDTQIAIAGASPAAYNSTFVCTIVNATTFTFPIASSTTSPATGTITCTNNLTQTQREAAKAAWVTWVADKKTFQAGGGADPGNFSYSGFSYS